MTDLISRADAIKAIRKCKFDSDMPSYWYSGMECAQDIISELPSADIDMSEYCDRLWKIAYERGKAESEAVQGEWILVKGSNGKYYHKCSKCLHTQEITGVKNYCAVCGARMKGGEDE